MSQITIHLKIIEINKEKEENKKKGNEAMKEIQSTTYAALEKIDTENKKEKQKTSVKT